MAVAFFQSSFITTLATAGTALLSLSFVFAVTTQEFLGSCIFLFVKHPYDVGDRVEITQEQLTVDKISLLYTVFTRIDKMQVVQVPNIVLNNLWIENVTRSRAMREFIDVNVSYDTTFEDIELLRLEMEKFVRAPENNRDFQPDLTIGVAGVGNLDKLMLKIAIKHKSNWHNEAVRAARRSKFMCALTLALKKVPIYTPGGGYEPLGGVNNPSYSVAVSDDTAATRRKEAAQSKDALRMVPTSAMSASDEEKAAQDLNTQSAVAGIVDDWMYNRDDNIAAKRERRESRRSNDVDSVRQEILKRASTRGRRRAGEGLPPTALMETGPGVSLTQASPRSSNFDEEAQTPTYPPGFTAVSGGQQPQYTIFPQRSYSPPGSSSGNVPGLQAGPLHPLQSQPVSGQRLRGQSVSNSGQGPPLSHR